MKKLRYLRKICYVIAISIILCSLKVYAKEKYEVHFLDTGQSDCILIKGKSFNILIDTGVDSTADKVIKYLDNNKLFNTYSLSWWSLWWIRESP